MGYINGDNNYIYVYDVIKVYVLYQKCNYFVLNNKLYKIYGV